LNGVVVTDDGDYENIIPVIFAIAAQAALFLGTKWSLRIRSLLDMRKVDTVLHASHAIMHRSASGNIVAICRIQKSETGVYYIENKCKRMFYDEKTGRFEKRKTELNLPISSYTCSIGLTPDTVKEKPKISMDIPIPDFYSLFQQHIIEPFFVFQLFCVLLWLLDEYWNYALMTLIMLVILEAQMVRRRIRDLTQLRSIKPPIVEIEVKRGDKWTKTCSSDIFEGDLLRLGSDLVGTSVPCDMLIIPGTLGVSALVNESMLTGESVPVLKEPVTESDEILDMNGVHKNSVLFSGSSLMAIRGSGPLHAVVLRTGFETSQGKLIRTILFASDRVTASSRDAFKFIVILFCVALVAASYVLYEGLNDGPVARRSRFKLFLSVSHILTSVIPPEFPITMSLTVTLALVHLVRNAVYCTEPFRIPLAGRITHCCFDKTGTLNSNEMVFEGVTCLPQSGGSADYTSKLVMACCHSLAYIDGQKLVGDPIEVAAFAACFKDGGWKYQDNDSVITPNGTCRISQRFNFDASIQRMSVVVELSTTKKRILLTKGSPESIFSLIDDLSGEKREWYMRTCESLASRGLRVLALAIRRDISVFDRKSVESNLEFVGFSTFSYSIKPDTVRTIHALSQSGHRCVMITGDHLLTAMHVGKQVGITGDEVISKNLSREEIVEIARGKRQLCVDGDPRLVIACGLANRVAIWARASPNDKKEIVAALGRDNGMVMFCGDGTNDVAALKEAAVGIALMEQLAPSTSPATRTVSNRLVRRGIVSPEDTSDMSALIAKPGDASIAAPFAYRGNTIRCVSLLIRSGRASLALVIQMYKILAVNSLITAFCLSVLTLRGIKLGDVQTAVEAFIMSILSFLMSRFPPSKVLPPATFVPVVSVFKRSVLFSIFAQATVHLVLLAYGQSILPPVGGDIDLDSKFTRSLANTIAFIQLFCAHLSSSIANFEGPPSLPNLTSSKPVVTVIGIASIALLLVTTGGLPELSDALELVEIPEELMMHVLFLVTGHLVGGWIIGARIK